MTDDHHGGIPLVTHSLRRCHACGLPTPTPLLHEASEEGLCPSCWLRSRSGFKDDQRQRVFEALAQRVRIGQRLGNGRAVAYPAGLDYHLTRVLDGLRCYGLRARVTIESDRFDDDQRVVEGHLRRYGPLDDVEDDFGLGMNLLGLFLNFEDGEPTTALDGGDFGRIVRIELIDHLLSHDPVVVWVASPEQVAHHAARRRYSFAREQRRAKLFLIHAAVVLAIWAGLLVPAVVALTSREWWHALGWWMNFAFIGFLSGLTLAFWEPGPDLMVLLRRRGEVVDSGTDWPASVTEARH
jgi:hypothetical protein